VKDVRQSSKWSYYCR